MKKSYTRIILGIIFAFLFIFSIDTIFWLVGILNATLDIIIAIVFSLIFVFVVGAILCAIELSKNKKQ